MLHPDDPIYIRARHSKWNRWLKVAAIFGVLVVAIDIIRQLGA
ncbi:hypothetical protein DFLDMN_001525 [Cupriavidus sp. H19C3]